MVDSEDKRFWPLKPIKVGDSTLCPVCENEQLQGNENFCPICGQKMYWGSKKVDGSKKGKPTN